MAEKKYVSVLREKKMKKARAFPERKETLEKEEKKIENSAVQLYGRRRRICWTHLEEKAVMKKDGPIFRVHYSVTYC